MNEPVLHPELQYSTAADAVADWPAWPSYGLVDDLLPTLERWAQAGHRVALATLVDIVGSSPRPLGSEMAISDTGEVAGFVSGGCVEGAVATEALAAMADGAPRLLDYGAGSPVLDVQLTCGGRIGIFVRVLTDATGYAGRLREARNRRQPLDVIIDRHSGEQRYATPPSAPEPDGASTIFTKTHLPPARLMLVGSDPVTLALCQLGPLFGYEIGLLRPYGPAAPPPSSELIHYDRRPLNSALPDLPLDAWTAVYTLTHDPLDDQAVLAHALRSPAFCVGAVGRRRKIGERLAALREAGLENAAEARLQTPAGVATGAREPREIALSILAELVSYRPR